VSKNQGYSEALVGNLNKLASEIELGEFRIADIDSQDGGPCWDEYCKGRIGQTVMQVEWFFLENYVYRLLLSSAYLDFFRGGVEDPFKQHKAGALAAGLASLHGFTHSYESCFQSFHELVLGCLWGNQMDLSLTSGELVDAEKGGLLIDNSKRCWEKVFESKEDQSIHVNFILDNCGSELLNDLIMMDFLLKMFPKLTCKIHAKSHPVFVSDATESDVLHHIKVLGKSPVESLSLVGKRLEKSLEQGRLVLYSHEFYTSPLPYWQVPDDLRKEYRDSFTITKGDANYRRLLDDRLWPQTTPFQEAMDYWGTNTTLLSIRTCKAPILVGRSLCDMGKRMESNDWIVDGSTGVICLYSPIK